MKDTKESKELEPAKEKKRHKKHEDDSKKDKEAKKKGDSERLRRLGGLDIRDLETAEKDCRHKNMRCVPHVLDHSAFF